MLSLIIKFSILIVIFTLLSSYLLIFTTIIYDGVIFMIHAVNFFLPFFMLIFESIPSTIRNVIYFLLAVKIMFYVVGFQLKPYMSRISNQFRVGHQVNSIRNYRSRQENRLILQQQKEMSKANHSFTYTHYKQNLEMKKANFNHRYSTYDRRNSLANYRINNNYRAMKDYSKEYYQLSSLGRAESMRARAESLKEMRNKKRK